MSSTFVFEDPVPKTPVEEMTKPKNKIDGLGLPKYYIPDPPAVRDAKKAAWDEIQEEIKAFQGLGEQLTEWRYYMFGIQMVPFLGGLVKWALEGYYTYQLFTLQEQAIKIYEFFDNDEVYGNPFEVQRIRLLRDRAYQARKMEDDWAAKEEAAKKDPPQEYTPECDNLDYECYVKQDDYIELWVVQSF